MTTFTMTDGSGTRTFEVGDRVTVSADTFFKPEDYDYGYYVGMNGTVTEISEGDDRCPVLVEFDNAHFGFDTFEPEELTHL